MGLIITGMHRSGTSALARVADAIGLPSGGPDMGPAPDNPRGFFERRDVMKVNDSWLADLGGSWWAPPETTSTTWRTLDRQRLAADRSALGLFDPGQGPWMVKDPRISLLMPLWDRLALQTLPAVLAIRDPREVAGSLELRNGMSTRRALALWAAYVVEALGSAHGRAMLVVDYGTLLAHPSDAVSSLSEFIVSQCDGETPVPSLDVLVGLVESGLNRNRGAVAYGVSEAELADVMDIYAYVMKAHLEPDVRLEAPDVPDWVRDALSDARDVWAAQRAADSAGHVIEELERELRDAVDAVDTARASLAGVRDLEEQRQALAQRLEELQGLLEGEHEARQHADRLRAEAEKRALDVVETAEQRTREMSVLEQELSRARLELAEAEERLEQMRHSATGVSQRTQNLQEEVVRRVAELAGMEQAIAALRSDHEERARTWERERLALTQEADQARTATEVLSVELERARDEAEQARDRVSQAESSLELIRRDSAQQLQSADEAQRTLEARLMAREEEATELRLRVASSAAEVQARASEVAQLQRLIETAQGEHSTQLSSWDAERADLRRQLDESGSAAAVLSAELERARLDLAQEHQTLGLLRDDLRAREQDLADLGEQLDAALGARDAAADQVFSLERVLAEVRGQYAAEATSWHRERELLMRGVDEARSEGQELVARIEVLSADLSETGEALLEARLECQSLETLRSRHEGIMLALTEQLARKTGLVGSLSARLAEAEKHRSEADAHAAQLVTDLATSTVRVTELEDQLEGERARLDEADARLTDVGIELTQSQVEINRLRAQSLVARESLKREHANRSDLQREVDGLKTRLHVEAKRVTELSERAQIAEDRVASLEQETVEASRRLDAEAGRSARLAEGLRDAIEEGQSLLTELEGLKASRSYRYGRRLTALGRALVGGPAVPPRIPARYVVPGVDASEVSRIVAEASFDPGWYLTTYQDVGESGVDPLFHYLAQGRLEGRLPGPRVQ